MSESASDVSPEKKDDHTKVHENEKQKTKTDHVDDLEKSTEALEDKIEETLQGWVMSSTSWGSAWLKTAKEKVFPLN